MLILLLCLYDHFYTLCAFSQNLKRRVSQSTFLLKRGFFCCFFFVESAWWTAGSSGWAEGTWHGRVMKCFGCFVRLHKVIALHNNVNSGRNSFTCLLTRACSPWCFDRGQFCDLWVGIWREKWKVQTFNRYLLLLWNFFKLSRTPQTYSISSGLMGQHSSETGDTENSK